MSSAKRIGSFFGIKRRPSNINTDVQDGGAGHSKTTPLSPTAKFTDFDRDSKHGINYAENNRRHDPDSSPPYEQSLFTISDQDPFAPPQWQAPVPPPLPDFGAAASRMDATIRVHDRSAEWRHERSSDLHDAFQEFRDPEDFEAPSGSSSDQHGRLGSLPPRRPSAISVDSLVSAHANANRNANVMVFQLEEAANIHGTSPGISTPSDESPSSVPHSHYPPYYSGILANAPILSKHKPRESHRHAESDIEEEEPQVIVVSECSVGSHDVTSLPTTPALIDSFPPTPDTPLPSRANARPVLSMLSTAPVQVPHSGRSRQRTVSSPGSRSISLSPIIAAHHNPDLDGVFDVAEQDEDSQSDYNYSAQSPSQAGPSSGVPPQESNSHWFNPSIIHKHFHPADFDLASLTRKLTSSSTSRPGTSTAISGNSSGSDMPKMIKKSSSYSRLRKDISGLSGSSAASSSQGMLSSASASSTAIHLSNSPTSDQSCAISPKRQRSPSTRAYPVPPLPSLTHRTSFGSKLATDVTTAPFKLKEKGQKGQKDKDLARTKEERGHEKEKEKDQFNKRKFFSKYASVGSHVDRDAAEMIAKIVDLEDARSFTSMRSGGGIPDEEWSANLSMALSSSLRTQESSVIMHSKSPSSQHKSPSEESSSSFFASQSPPQNALSPTTSESPYVLKHIVPPAELLRLEQSGFNDEALHVLLGSRGRDIIHKFGSPTSTSPMSASPGSVNLNNSRRSTSTSRLPESTMSPIAKTRSQRSGSLAVPTSSPSSPSLSGSARPRPLDSPKLTRPSTATTLGGSQSGSGFNVSMPQRRVSNGSALSTKRLGERGSITSPPSPTEMETTTSLPPPPRPRIHSARSSTDIRHGARPFDSPTRPGANVLSPPPNFSRRPSIASTVSSTDSSRTQVVAQRPISTVKKSNFLDISDEEGRPSLEEANLDSAPGILTPDNRSFVTSTPVPRSRSHTISTTWTSSAATAYSNAELSMTSFGTRPTASKMVDSFLDMGKLSLDTIRSEDEEQRFSPDAALGGKLAGTPAVPSLSRYQYSTTIGIGSRY